MRGEERVDLLVLLWRGVHGFRLVLLSERESVAPEDVMEDARMGAGESIC